MQTGNRMQMGNQLNNQDEDEQFNPRKSCSIHTHETANTLDETWLLERCDGDLILFNEVLQTFCAQGLLHIDAMHQSQADGDSMATLFHVVH